MAEIVDRKITQNEFNSMSAPMELDLIAYFKLVEELVMETLDPTVAPEIFIDNVMSIFSESTKGTIIGKSVRPEILDIKNKLMQFGGLNAKSKVG